MSPRKELEDGDDVHDSSFECGDETPKPAPKAAPKIVRVRSKRVSKFADPPPRQTRKLPRKTRKTRTSTRSEKNGENGGNVGRPRRRRRIIESSDEEDDRDDEGDADYSPRISKKSLRKNSTEKKF